MVFLESLKDTRPTAPNMSCGSWAGQIWPIAQNVLIRATQPDIALRCCGALVYARIWAAGEIRRDALIRKLKCAGMVSSRHFFAQET